MHIPYELIEKTFGTFVADNFNEISASLCVLGLILYFMRGGGNRPTTT